MILARRQVGQSLRGSRVHQTLGRHAASEEDGFKAIAAHFPDRHDRPLWKAEICERFPGPRGSIWQHIDIE